MSTLIVSFLTGCILPGLPVLFVGRKKNLHTLGFLGMVICGLLMSIENQSALLIGAAMILAMCIAPGDTLERLDFALARRFPFLPTQRACRSTERGYAAEESVRSLPTEFSMVCDHCGAPIVTNSRCSMVQCEYCGSSVNVILPEHVARKADARSGNLNAYRSTRAVSRAVDYNISPKSRLAALFLCYFLGIFGAHRYYVGKTKSGLVYTFTFGFLAIGWFADLIMILCGAFEDSNGRKVKNWY